MLGLLFQASWLVAEFTSSWLYSRGPLCLLAVSEESGSALRGHVLDMWPLPFRSWELTSLRQCVSICCCCVSPRLHWGCNWWGQSTQGVDLMSVFCDGHSVPSSHFILSWGNRGPQIPTEKPRSLAPSVWASPVELTSDLAHCSSCSTQSLLIKDLNYISKMFPSFPYNVTSPWERCPIIKVLLSLKG